MKKYILILLIFLTIPFSTHADTQATSAMGSIQILNFSSHIAVPVGQKFTEIYIGFLYSGSNPDGLGVSIVGGKLPTGMKLDSIEPQANGLYNVGLYGTPTQVGDFPLTIVISDNNGVMATQPLDFNVSGVTFTGDSTLPDGIYYKKYSQNINYTYASDANTSVHIFFTITPSDGSQPFYANGTGYNGTAELTFMPEAEGRFTVKAEASIPIDNLGDTTETAGTKTFTLTVDKTAQPAVQQAQTATQTPTVSNTTPSSEPANANHTTTVVSSTSKKSSQNVVPKSSDQIAQVITGAQSVNTQNTNSAPPPAITTTTDNMAASQTPTLTVNQTQSKTSSNIFSNIWNFIKNIFK